MGALQVEIWSDVVCPWCYIGKRRFEAALKRFDHEVRVRWRSFRLDPDAPTEQDVPLAEHLAAKYGVSRTEGLAMLDRVTAAAAGEGLEYRFDRARRGNTLDAHRLLHLAADRGAQEPLKERLLAAYFTEGEPIGDPAALFRLAVGAGLDPGEVEEVLAGDAYRDAVRRDEEEARMLGVTGVPFFVVERAFGAGGAQPPEVLLDMLERARSAAAAR
jgi:predicted DsbA family dithiol-disulfide isomerase